jgi:nucleotide-binding universal stress UspA family protein
MTRLTIGYDGSSSARAAVAAAAALFPGAEATVMSVYAPAPSLEAGALVRMALPESIIDETLARLEVERSGAAGTSADEGAELALAAGLQAHASVVNSPSVWRALHQAGSESDVLVCGTRGLGSADRILLGSTASTLLHQSPVPLLVVPSGAAALDGPSYVGWDSSEGARRALRFAAAHLRERPVRVAHAWHSPVRHSLRGHAFARSPVARMADYAASVDEVYAETARETADEGLAYARELGLIAEADQPESGHGDWQTLLQGAQAAGAAALLVGSRGRGAFAATALGSVASGLVHAAAMPIIVVPDGPRPLARPRA